MSVVIYTLSFIGLIALVFCAGRFCFRIHEFVRRIRQMNSQIRYLKEDLDCIKDEVRNHEKWIKTLEKGASEMIKENKNQ